MPSPADRWEDREVGGMAPLMLLSNLGTNRRPTDDQPPPQVYLRRWGAAAAPTTMGLELPSGTLQGVLVSFKGELDTAMLK